MIVKNRVYRRYLKSPAVMLSSALIAFACPLAAIAHSSSQYVQDQVINSIVPGSEFVKDGLGVSMKKEGDYLFISAPFARPASATNIVSGVVYVYKQKRGQYILKQTISTNGLSDHIGANKIEADGDWLLISGVGTPLGPVNPDTLNNQDFRGAVLVYKRNKNDVYELKQTIDNNIPGLDLTIVDPVSFTIAGFQPMPVFSGMLAEQGASFGLYFAMDESKKKMLISAQYQQNGTSLNSGAVYAFEFDKKKDKWMYTGQKITNPDGIKANDSFGANVAISDDVAIISNGSFFQFPKMGSFAENGAVYVFNYDKRHEQWEYVQKVTGDQTATPAALPLGTILGIPNFPATPFPISDCFGASLSMDDDLAVVGAPLESSNPNQFHPAGAAYLYKVVKSGGDKKLQKIEKIQSADPNALLAGWRVKLHEDELLVSVPGAQNLPTFYTGNVLLYSVKRDNATLVQTLSDPTSPAFDMLGGGIELDKDEVIIANLPLLGGVATQGYVIIPENLPVPLLNPGTFPDSKVIIYKKD